MRILEINLIAFGPFTDLRVDLSAGEYGLHIIYGPNEAGKSASLRALKSLFYGIPARTCDNFLHDNQAIRLGARIRHSDGDTLEFMRRKGNKDTLLDPAGKPIADSSLAKFVNGTGEEVFSTMFGIDHESLILGGEQILSGGGAIGESLFAAGMGGTNLREVLKSLEEEASRLFLPRGKSQLISNALNAYKEAKQKSTQASLSSRDWAEHDAALKEAAKRKNEVDSELRSLGSEKSRLERLKKALPRIAERRELHSRLDRIGKVKILAPSFGKKRREAVQKLTSAREVEKTAVDALTRIGQKIEALNIPELLLREAEAITDLQERLGSHRKAFRDLPRLQGECTQLSADAASILKELRPDLGLKDVESVRLTAAKRMRIRELGNQHQALHDRVIRCLQDLGKIEAKLARKREEQKGLNAPREAGKLRIAVTRAQKQGEIEADLKTAMTAHEAARRQSEIELKQLGLWFGTLEELESLPVPAPETIDRFESALDALKHHLQGLSDRITKIQNWKADLDRKINELRLAGSVPSEDDLDMARKRRENGWSLVRRAWLDGNMDPEALRAFDPDSSLATAYEKSVAHADLVADRLRREADRVAQQATFIAQRTKYVEELNTCERERADIEGMTRKLNEDWLTLWRPMGISPHTPKEMRSWIAKQEKLVQRAEKLRADHYRIETIKQKIDEHRNALSDCLQGLGEQSAGPEETLDSLITRALILIDGITESERKQKQAQQAITQLEEDLTTAIRKKDDSAAALGRWEGEWSQAVEDLGLSGGASPAEANAVLDKIEELFKRIDKMAGVSGRIAGIGRDGEEFERHSKLMAQRLAPALAELSAEQIAVELNSMLREALENSATLAELKEQQKELDETIRRARATIQASEVELNALCREAGCNTYDELEQIEERSAGAQAIKKEIEAIEKQLLDYGGGSSIDELIFETGEIDSDSLPSRIADIAEAVKGLENMRSELLESIGREKSRLDMMDGSAEAAEAAERAQAVLAQIREAVNRYTRLRLASIILHREIERYRSENQDPLLRRSGELFSRFTLGAFESLQADYNELDEPILLGVRPGGNRVRVQGMSEGTRDQLYLSLRLASLEKYLQQNEPLPLIIDDILINFDDRRAEATLKVMDELSRSTQIIFFTHHIHLLELAKAAVDEKALHIHFLARDPMVF